MNSAFASWSGAARSARKHKQQQAWQAQEQAIQNVLSRLDPDGDGVVDQDEFTSWAKEQALRAELMAKQVDGALAELRESQAFALDEQQAALDELRDGIDHAVNQVSNPLAWQNVVSSAIHDRTVFCDNCFVNAGGACGASGSHRAEDRRRNLLQCRRAL